MRRAAQKEQVSEGLVRRCAAEEIGKSLGSRGVTETSECIGPSSATNLLIENTSPCNGGESGILLEFLDMPILVGTWQVYKVSLVTA